MNLLEAPLDGLEQALEEADETGELFRIERRLSVAEARLDSNAPARLVSRVETLKQTVRERVEEKVAPIRTRIAEGALTPEAFRAQVEPMPPRHQNNLVAHVFGIVDPPERERPTPIPYAPAPTSAILDVVDLAPVEASDVFIDIGAGLGHVTNVVSFLTGARAIGVEIEPAFVERARRQARALSLERAHFECIDAFDFDFAGANVFFLFAPFPREDTRALLEEKIRPLAHNPGFKLCTLGANEQVTPLEWLSEVVHDRRLAAGLHFYEAAR